MSYGGMNKRPWQKEEKITERHVDAPLKKKRQECPDYDRNIEKLEEIMKYGGSFRTFYGPRGSEIIRNAYTICKKHMDALAYDEEVTPTDEEVREILRSIDIILDKVLIGEITPFVRDLTMEYCLLIINWNNNIGLSDDISRKSIIARRFVLGHLAFLDLINISKELVSKMGGVIRHVPAGFELSRHYLEILDEEK
jgi:hypothetical protein